MADLASWVRKGLPRWMAAARRNAAGATGAPMGEIIFPPGGANVDGPIVTDAWSAWKLPSMGRAAALYEGMIGQMPIDDVKGVTAASPRPRLLEAPDPNKARSWFVKRQIHDYFAHGNALSLVTVRDAAGWPAAAVWIPAQWVDIEYDREVPGLLRYSIDSVPLPSGNVIHVQRGADPWFPARGVGIVEQHMRTLDRAGLEEEYERRSMVSGGVPSAAVITNNPLLGEEKAGAAKKKWMALFGHVGREPAILPAGTQVIPLAWSPTDAQLVEARKMSLTDIANVWNLDGYWLGAPSATFTYKSPGPMYLNLLRTSLEPVLADLEGTWSQWFLPRGRVLRFDRLAITRDDFASSVATVLAAITSTPPLMTQEEARVYLGLSPQPEGGWPDPPAPSTNDPATQEVKPKPEGGMP